MQRFRGGLVFKAHRLLYHSTLGLRVIKKKKNGMHDAVWKVRSDTVGFGFWDLGFRV